MSYTLPTAYQNFIAKSRYARWLDDKNRRETWDETINRYLDFFFVTNKSTATHLQKKLALAELKALREELYAAMGTLEALPSMRCLMTAGPALERDHIAAYNCANVNVDDPKVFSETLHILLNGAGVGFSVERQFINKLPEVPDEFFPTNTTIVVEDSKLGWAKSYHELITLLYQGQVPKWDLSKVRPAGARLKTFGGRASGPEPLDRLFKFTVNTFKNASGRRLESIECHDIQCMIGEIVVVGGVRRCLPEHSLVPTSKGVFEIKDIKPGMLVYSDKGKLAKVLASESVGRKKTVTINTRSGSITCTPKHRVAILTDIDTGEYAWKEARHVGVGDTLMYSNLNTNGGNAKHPSFSYEIPNHSTTCKPIDVDAISTLEFAWFIGYFHGNGCVTNSCREIVIAVPNDMPKTKQRLIKDLEMFGVNVGDAVTGEGCWKLRVKSRQLALYLSQFKQSNTTMRIPQFVLQGELACRYDYLAGLFDADGSAKTSRPGRKTFNVVTTVYKEYAEQVAGLLGSFGVPYKMHVNVPANDNWKTKYSVILTVSSYKDKLALLFENVSEKINNDYVWKDTAQEQAVPVVAPELVRTSKFAKNFESTYSHETNLPWTRYVDASRKSYWYIPALVTSVVESDSYECYDIQVEGTEAFFANGFFVHNSALLSLSNLSDLRMRDAKSGNWWETYPHRKLANNSVAYTERPEIGHFMDEWLALFRSHSGERGIINREALRYGAKKYGKRDASQIVGCNPCCFTGETKVLTATRGSVTIKNLADVSEGIVQFDVMCAQYSAENKAWFTQIKKAVAKQTGEKDVYLVTTSRGTSFKSTDDHPLAQADGTYVQVKDAINLNVQTMFQQDDGKQIKIVSVEHVGVEPIYDLTVEDNHNFYIVPENSEVSEAILVHNSEIALRSMQFCNLSTVVLRPEDTKEDIMRKVRIAAIFGTMQATLTSFKFLRKKWKQNTEEEALLGVSMTGILDHPLLGLIHSKERDELLNDMRLEVERVNKEYAELFEINTSTATTCIKPEGTVSELVDSSSGIHPRFSKHYIRAVRGDNKDPLTQFLKTTGIHWEPENGKESSTTVFYFPKKAPETSVTRDEITAIEQLELWKNFQEHYCEHKPSITVYVRENEWLEVAAWVWKNFDMVSGVSFLPYDNGIYQQAPYNACSEEEYLEALNKMPEIDWVKLEEFEHDDASVTATREYACTGGSCELR